VCICFQIGAGICAVATADTVATDKVNCYNCIVYLCSLPRVVETILVVYKKTVLHFFSLNQNMAICFVTGWMARGSLKTTLPI